PWSDALVKQEKPKPPRLLRNLQRPRLRRQRAKSRRKSPRNAQWKKRPPRQRQRLGPCRRRQSKHAPFRKPMGRVPELGLPPRPQALAFHRRKRCAARALHR